MGTGCWGLPPAAGPPSAHLEGVVKPEHRARRDVPDAMQVSRDQAGVREPATEHVVGLVAHAGQQGEGVCGEQQDGAGAGGGGAGGMGWGCPGRGWSWP